jgi:predicted alpha/beta-fold hydrolase
VSLKAGSTSSGVGECVPATETGGVVVESEFTPAWWLSNPHLQTLWPVMFRWRPKPSLERERLELPDGDFVDVDWTGNGERLALILHGLEGGSSSPYARGLVSALARRGYRAGVLHFRSCSGSLNRLPRNYHSGDTADLAYVASRLVARRGCRSLSLVGFSLGGNVLLRWLAEMGADAPVVAAAAVSVPFLLNEVAARLERGLSRLYQWRLVSALKRKMRLKFASRPLPSDIADFAAARTFYQFDDTVTAPLHGFADADDYYARASCRPVLGGVRRPTLIIHALDDPFMVPGVVPQARELSPQTRLEISAGGGHVGFIAGAIPGVARYWLEERIPDYLDDVTSKM